MCLHTPMILPGLRGFPVPVVSSYSNSGPVSCSSSFSTRAHVYLKSVQLHRTLGFDLDVIRRIKTFLRSFPLRYTPTGTMYCLSLISFIKILSKTTITLYRLSLDPITDALSLILESSPFDAYCILCTLTLWSVTGLKTRTFSVFLIKS